MENNDPNQTELRANLIKKYIETKKKHDYLEVQVKNTRKANENIRKEIEQKEEAMNNMSTVGQYIAEVLKKVTDDKQIIKTAHGPRYLVGCRTKLDKKKLITGARISIEVNSQTIMRILPREVDASVYKMLSEDPGKVDQTSIGGLGDQLREIRETIELPLNNPELFKRVGIKAPKGVLLYGPPGTGKTLLARCMASNLETNFLKVVASSIVDKQIGESERMIREMFAQARQHQPCIIFMDEIDAIGGKRSTSGHSSDREVQRTLMELLNQLDGFDELGMVKFIAATNRPDTLDDALMRPGRLDRKIEISLPNEQGRSDILKIHAKPISKMGEIDFDLLAKMCEGFNGADLRNVTTEGGLFAIRDDREQITLNDLTKAARKIKETKKLETTLSQSKQ